jgi:hypothetical protein
MAQLKDKNHSSIVVPQAQERRAPPERDAIITIRVKLITSSK